MLLITLQFLKKYWRETFIAVLILVLGLVVKFSLNQRSTISSLEFERNLKLNETKTVVETLETMRKQHEENVKQLQELLAESDAKYTKTLKELETARRTQVAKIAKENPNDIARRLGDLYGIKIITN